MKKHGYFKNDKPDGLVTEFDENGDRCVQIEYINGQPRYDYYIISNKDGFSSKFRLSDKTPIWETPNKNEMKSQYNDGLAWLCYKKNGLFIAVSNIQVKDYGKYYRIPIIIANQSILPINFNPDEIRSTITDSKNRTIPLHVLSVDEYMKTKEFRNII